MGCKRSNRIFFLKKNDFQQQQSTSSLALSDPKIAIKFFAGLQRPPPIPPAARDSLRLYLVTHIFRLFPSPTLIPDLIICVW